jgi:hypothetical protein
VRLEGDITAPDPFAFERMVTDVRDVSKSYLED